MTRVIVPVMFLLAATACAAPVINITSVAPWGQCGSASGTVSGVNTGDYRVALLIFIPGSGWWTKPSCATTAVPIQPGGSWSGAICSSGTIDNTATLVDAYLVPKTCTPPCVLGNACVPDAIARAAVACDRKERTDPAARRIIWSGFEWLPKCNSVPIGPGPCYFSCSASNSWVDAQGRLHLKITHDAPGGGWNCVELISEKRFGYGTYRFYIDSRLDNLDPNVVLGLFIWSDQACAEHHREIDFEFSRWGNGGDTNNAQFVLQPWDAPGNRLRYAMPSCAASTHSFRWSRDAVHFVSVCGHCSNPAQCTMVREWDYTNASGIPASRDERLHINLWLAGGNAPQNGQEAEVIISRFEFEPLTGVGGRTVGLSARAACDPIVASAGAKPIFRMWGRATAAECDTTKLRDGSVDISGQPIEVTVIAAPGHGIRVGDYVLAEGELSAGPTLIACDGCLRKLD